MNKKLFKFSLLTFISAISISTAIFSAFTKNKSAMAVDAASQSIYDSFDTSTAKNLYNDLKEHLSSNFNKSHSYDSHKSTYPQVYYLYKNNKKIIFDFYSDISEFNANVDTVVLGGGSSTEGQNLNREHSIPKSWWPGGDNLGAERQGADPFIVLPTDAAGNGARSNFPYGEVQTVTKHSKNNYWLLGSGKSSTNYTGTVFEPHDSLKGDLARVYFYAATKYNAGLWHEKDGGDLFFSETGKYNLATYGLNLLKKWHTEDPVSDWERTVNDRMEPIYYVRNPYIDHPEYIDYIWYGKPLESRTLTSIKISGTPTRKTYIEGESFNPSGLTVTATYDDNTTKDVTSNVVWLPNPLTYGNTSVTATYIEGSIKKTATYNGITVTQKPQEATLVGLSYTGKPEKTIYTEGESFKPQGLLIQAMYSDGTVETVTDKLVWTPNPLTYGTTSVRGSYKGKEIVVEGITVNKKEIIPVTTETYDFTLTGEYNLTNGQEVNKFSKENSSVTFNKGTNNNTPKYYSSGDSIRIYGGGYFNVSSTTSTITKIEITFGSGDGSNELTPDSGSLKENIWIGSSNTVTFTVGGSSGNRRIAKLNISFQSNTPDPTPTTTLTSINVQDISKEYFVGQKLNTSDVIVKAIYSDSSEKTLNINNVSISNLDDAITYDDDRMGYKQYSVSYKENDVTKTTSFKISNISRKPYITPVAGESNATIDFSTMGYENAQEVFNATQGNLQVSFTKGANNNPAYYNTGKAIRVYGGGTFSVISSSAKIIKIEITFGSGDGSNSLKVNTGTLAQNIWTGSSNTVTFTVDGTSGHRRISKLVVHLEQTALSKETALNIANFIMFEDTENQCKIKFSQAKNKILSLSSTELSVFENSDDYVINEARNRYERWAEALNESPYSTASLNRFKGLIQTDNNFGIIVIVASLVTVCLFGFIFLKTKKK